MCITFGAEIIAIAMTTIICHNLQSGHVGDMFVSAANDCSVDMGSAQSDLYKMDKIH